MRVRHIHIIIGAALLLFLASCRKETSIENKTGLGGSFMANVDGVQWIADDSAKGAYVLQGMINLSGISIDHRQLSITLDDTVPGIYTLNQASASLAAYADNDTATLFAYTTNEGRDTSQAGGVVTVTEIDTVNKTLSGTFSFKVYRDLDNRQKTITEGVFYKLPYQSTLPPVSSLDTMYANIDGTKWTAQSIAASAFSNMLAISGSNPDGSQAVGLLMLLNVAPGNSYSLDLGNNVGTYSPTVSINLPSPSGSLMILENNASTRRVRGNFQFLAADVVGLGNTSHLITNGYFSVQYN